VSVCLRTRKLGHRWEARGILVAMQHETLESLDAGSEHKPPQQKIQPASPGEPGVILAGLCLAGIASRSGASDGDLVAMSVKMSKLLCTEFAKQADEEKKAAEKEKQAAAGASGLQESGHGALYQGEGKTAPPLASAAKANDDPSAKHVEDPKAGQGHTTGAPAPAGKSK